MSNVFGMDQADLNGDQPGLDRLYRVGFREVSALIR